MSRRVLLCCTALMGPVALLAAFLAAAPAHAAVGPYYDVRTTWGDTYLPPGGEGQFQLQVRNVGDEFVEAPLTITDQLPAGVTATGIFIPGSVISGEGDLAPAACSGVGTGMVECELPAAGRKLTDYGRLKPYPEESGYLWQIFINVEIDPGASETGTNVARVEGGGAAEPFTDEDQVPFSPTPAPAGIVPGSFLADVFDAAYPLGAPSRQAGARPYELRVNFEFNQLTGVGEDGTRYSLSTGLVRTVEATLPRGMIGNPEALPKCDPVDFTIVDFVTSATACPANTQVGYLNLSIGLSTKNFGRGGSSNSNDHTKIPIYSLEPPKGTPADFGFALIGGIQAHIYPAPDPAQDYAIKAVTPDILAPSLIKARATEVTFWGVPGDPAHDRFRFDPVTAQSGASFAGPIRPLLTNPMDCGFDNGGTRLRIDTYEGPGEFSPVQQYGDPLNVIGCDDPRFRFRPDLTLQPTSRDAGGPTGLDVHLEVPQRSDEVDSADELYAEGENSSVKAIPTPPIKKAVVTFPEGMTINPSAAQGLGSCTSEQIGMGTDKPVTCPDSSQYGTLTLHTPLLPVDEQPEGFIYIAKQGDNPFHNFLSLYLVIQEPDRGILVKISGRVDLDPVTGQVTTTFDNLPQFPVSDMQMTLKGGVRAGLVNPSTCGRKTIRAEFFSWHDPSTPHPVADSYEITRKPDGSPCINSLAERPFRPQLSAGTLNPIAGAFSAFVFRLTRTDDDQEFSQLGVSPPEGLLAKLAGVSECPEKAIEQAQTPSRTGAEEAISPSCPASALIGTTQVGAGVGVPLTYVPGRVYLAGPYKGAPLSMVVITPALVGPFDLGVIAVRTAVNVDPQTTQVSTLTDPLPLIFKGIPVRIRDIRLRLDRDQFTLNPTSCTEKQTAAHLTGSGGNLNSTADDTLVSLATRFQLASCASLGFKPKLFMRLQGGTSRGAHPRLRAILRARAGDANIAGAQVTLPRSVFLDQGHIRTVCTRVQFAKDACPAGSVYGHARATTPLLDRPLSGPVYLRSSSHKLPDLVAALKGQLEVDLLGRIDSINGGIRTTFERTPDAPVKTFVLSMQGGQKGLLVNSTDLCARTVRATAKFRGHNGKRRTLRPQLRSSCRARSHRSK